MKIADESAVAPQVVITVEDWIQMRERMKALEVKMNFAVGLALILTAGVFTIIGALITGFHF